MKMVSICCIALLLLTVHGSATLAMYEAGKAVICIDDDFEKNEIGSMVDYYPTLYFEPANSREEVRNNEYTFVKTDVSIMTPGDLAIVTKPIRVMISDDAIDINESFTFVPNPVKNISIGKLGLINTTLYAGSWEDQTPHLVAFTEGNFSCCIYGQDIKQDEIEDFLSKIDVISKEDLADYLPKLWTE
jgi:hypothetical protein